jgi:superfamily II DNA or RNA helicase
MRRPKDRDTFDLFGERPVAVDAATDDKLRWYQFAARSSVYEELETGRSTLVVLATGLGKTELFSSVARHWPGRVLVLAHRDELVTQARSRLERMTGEKVEIEQAELRSSAARIVVGSVQTVYRDERLQRLLRLGGFSLIIVDEAHHYVSPTYRKALDFFGDAKVLGVTATPDRSDAKALGQIFDSVAYSMDLRDGVEQGYLVPLAGREVDIAEVDLDAVSISNGDLSAAQLDEAMVRGVEGIVQGMLQHSGTRQGVVFFPGVESSKVAAARFNAIRPDSARSVDGETPKDERKALMADFRAGKFQFLCNCMVATEGFDAPTASVVGLARPTKSRSLYAQMVGRGTRVLPGTVDHIDGEELAHERRAAIAASAKTSCLLLDFVGNNTKHALITPDDLLGGTYDADEKKRARKIRKESSGDVDVQESLADARTQLQRERLELAAKQVRAKVTSMHRDFDPFAMYGVSRERENEFTLEFGYKPMSEAQRSFLLREGFAPDALSKVSARAASRLIGGVIKRRKDGLMSHKQAAMLSRYGVSDTQISSRAASAAIDYVRRGKVNPHALAELVSNEEF